MDIEAPPARTEPAVVWEGKGERLTLRTMSNGDVLLLRPTDYDSGATRSFVIPAAAVALVKDALP